MRKTRLTCLARLDAKQSSWSSPQTGYEWKITMIIDDLSLLCYKGSFVPQIQVSCQRTSQRSHAVFVASIFWSLDRVCLQSSNSASSMPYGVGAGKSSAKGGISMDFQYHVRFPLCRYCQYVRLHEGRQNEYQENGELPWHAKWIKCCQLLTISDKSSAESPSFNWTFMIISA